MKLLDTQLVHLFHYMDNLSMLCLIVLEDLEQEASFDSDNLEPQKTVMQNIEKWCQNVLTKLSIFLNNDKFIRNKTCFCEECASMLGNDNEDILQIYYKILDTLPEILSSIKQVDMTCYCITPNHKVYTIRLSRFINEMKDEAVQDQFREMILFCSDTWKTNSTNDKLF